MKRPITGHGEPQYEVIHDWGNLPSNIGGNTACKVFTVPERGRSNDREELLARVMRRRFSAIAQPWDSNRYNPAQPPEG